MDYSKIDAITREEIADRVAVAVLRLELLIDPATPAEVFEIILKLRRELVQLVDDLGGSSAMQGSIFD